jgi:hypothetical protein
VELYGLGARAVKFLNKAYSSDIHRPIQVSEKDRQQLGGSVGFIGAYERERAESIAFLAENGISVRVWGGGCERGWNIWAKRHQHTNLQIETRGVWGDLYTRTICSFDINLGFLRKLNRDLQTTRSVEIPACGKFMLAERTAEHLGLFTEGVEAEFFSTNEELLQKCRHYLSWPDERETIALAGRQRCLRSGYSYEKHVGAVLDELGKIRSRAR